MNLELGQDIGGNNYYVVDVNTFDDDSNGKNFVKILLDFQLKVDNANTYNKNLLKRNNDRYHVTVLNVPEYNSIKDEGDLPVGQIKDIIFKGIGSISKDDKTTYFVVCESKTLDEVRELLEFKPKDFHITIGFTDTDLFHNRKNNPNITQY